jgi:hypothetical protein
VAGTSESGRGLSLTVCAAVAIHTAPDTLTMKPVPRPNNSWPVTLDLQKIGRAHASTVFKFRCRGLVASSYSLPRWHLLYLRPLLHGHGSLRPTFMTHGPPLSSKAPPLLRHLGRRRRRGRTDGSLFLGRKSSDGARTEALPCNDLASAGDRVPLHPRATLMPKPSDEWCEALLTVASTAYEEGDGKARRVATTVSYETGSNRAEWA